MTYESVILILFVIASAVSVVARRVNLPYTIALMAVGLLLGSLNLLNPPHLTQELLYSIFLPPLVFEAAIHLRASELFKNIWLVVTLAVPGVVIAALVTATVMVPMSAHFSQIVPISWPVGILFGAAVAATDPVAVGAIFKKLGAPRRLLLLIESESLLNDGTSIVAFIIAVQFIQGALGSPQDAVIDFFRIVGLGILVGSIVGIVSDALMRRIDDAMVVITITTVAAFGSFLMAEHLGVSGVMSCVAAGLICGERSFYSGAIFPSIRISTETFWEYVAFAMNSLIFLLMGFAIDIGMLLRLWPLILIAYVAVLAARFLVVSGTWAIFYSSRHRLPYRWSIILGWGGLRGALSMVLALSIPDSLPFKEMIVTLVFGVVLISIFFQGLTMTWLMRFTGVASSAPELRIYELLKAQLILIQETLDEIEKLYNRHLITPKSARALKEEFRKQLNAVSKKIETVSIDKEALIHEEVLRTKRRILIQQKAKLLEMYHSGSIGLEAYETLKNELDTRLLELETSAP